MAMSSVASHSTDTYSTLWNPLSHNPLN